MLKLCCFLLGEDYALLKTNTPQSRKKVYLQATAIMVPVITWAVLGYLIACDILSHDVQAGLFTSLAFGLIVFALERLILMGNGHWTIVTLRILLAVAIALLAAMFIDQLIFKSDIDQELSLMKEEQKEEAFKIASADLVNEIKQRKITVNESNNLWQNAVTNMVKEADASGGTMKKGVGAVTELKAGVSNRMETEYLKEKESLTQTKQNYYALKDKIDAQTEANFNSTGLLNRCEALDRLYDKSEAVKKAFWLITAVFFFLEFIVVIAKYSMGKTSYERLLEIQEHIAERRQNHIIAGQSPLTRPERMDPGLKSARENLLGKRPGMFN